MFMWISIFWINFNDKNCIINVNRDSLKTEIDKVVPGAVQNTEYKKYLLNLSWKFDL